MCWISYLCSFWISKKDTKVSARVRRKLNISIWMSSQNLYVEILTPNGMKLRGWAFLRWLSHEGGTLVNGISALIRKDTREMIAVSTMWGYKEKMVICNPEEVSHQNLTCWHLDLRLPTSRTVRNKCLLFISHPDYGVLLYQPEKRHFFLFFQCLSFSLMLYHVFNTQFPLYTAGPWIQARKSNSSVSLHYLQ